MANEFKIRKGLIVEGATGGTVVDVQGSLGQLFSVTDNLTGEIFAVADISGVPIMSINSSGSIKFGSYSGTNQTGTPTYMLGTTATGGVVKVLGADIPGVPGGSGTLNTIPLWTPDGDTLGNSVMTQSGVNIGIGTTSYTNSSGYSTLNINGTTGGQIAFQTAGTSKHFIWGTATDFNIYNGQAGPLIFYTSASEAMRINSSRDVLIGNTVVNPASNFSNQKGFGYKFSTGQTEIANTGGETLTLGRNIAADGDILVLRKQATVIGVFGSNTAGGDPLLDIASAPGEDSLMRFLTSGSERLRIDKVGNVGIGVVPVTSWDTFTALQIQGSSLSGLGQNNTVLGSNVYHNSNAFKYIGTGAATLYQQRLGEHKWFGAASGTAGNTASVTQHMVIDSSGNVGIGTTLPVAAIDVQRPANGTGRIRIFSALHSSNNTIEIDQFGQTHPNAPKENQIGVSNAEQHLSLVTDSSAIIDAGTSTKGIFLRSGGNVGIGTKSPGSTLTLGNATGNVAELRVLRSNSISGTYGFINTTGGTAQIGGSGDTRIIASTGRLLFNSNNTDQISLEANGEYRLKLGSTTTGYEASMDNSNTAYRIFGSRFGGTGKYVAIWSDGANENTRFYPTKTIFYQNVGIGTDSPIDKLAVDGGTGDTTAQQPKIAVTRTSSTGNVLVGKMILTTSPDTTNHGNLAFQVKTIASSGESSAYYTDAITIDGRNANVGIGTTTPLAKLDVQGTQGQLFSVTDDLSGEIFAVADISGVPIMTVNSSGVSYFDGNVGIGDSTPSYKLDVAGTIRATGDVIAYSDVRVKENIKTIENSLEKVNQLRGVEFNKIGDDEKSIGVIAQEIEKVIPEVVKTDEEGMKSVAYGNISGLLIEAIKELKAEIEELKKKIK